MPLFMLLAILSKTIILATSPLFKLFYLPKISAKIYLWDKAFIKTKYLQNCLGLQSRVAPLFYKLIFCWCYKRISNTFTKTFQGRCYVSTSFWKIYKSFTHLFGTLFYLTMAWSSLSPCSIIVSGDARLGANDWPCVVSWLCVTVWLWWVIIACAWLCLTLLDYFLCVWMLCLEDFPYSLLFIIAPYWCLVPSEWSQEVSKSLDKMLDHPNS
jgi:hypothetical protein